MLAAWLIPRRIAVARHAAWPVMLLDLAPVGFAAALLLLATARPVFSGLIVFALGAGLGLADWTKRDVLREPVVFSDMSELPHVFTHPQLYLPFAGPGLVIGGALAAVTLGAALLAFEPPLSAPQPGLALCCGLAAGALGWIVSREPALSTAAAVLRKLDPVGEPIEDAARIGPFALLLTYGIIARAERTERRARHAPLPAPVIGSSARTAAVPLVLVQCESFFDARRLSPAIPSDLLPAFDACRNGCALHGRLDVGGWGANTMRAEFAALTGIPDSDLGYDRFNPYHALARAPIASLVRHLGVRGYRTLCLHPFDRGFFHRDQVMPRLGFDEFRCRETLGGTSRPPYFADPDLARCILDAIEEEGPRVFVFAITMGNHGPWRPEGPAVDGGLARHFDSAGVPQGAELLRYLDGLRGSDKMLGILMEGMEQRGRDGILGFYGDHLPSLPRAFDHFGFGELSSDYVLWPGDASSPRRLDIAASVLPRILLETLRARGAIGSPAPSEPVFADGAS